MTLEEARKILLDEFTKDFNKQMEESLRIKPIKQKDNQYHWKRKKKGSAKCQHQNNL